MAKGLPSVIIGCFIAYVNIDSDLEIMIKQYIDAFLRVFGLQRIETETPIIVSEEKIDNHWYEVFVIKVVAFYNGLTNRQIIYGSVILVCYFVFSEHIHDLIGTVGESVVRTGYVDLSSGFLFSPELSPPPIEEVGRLVGNLFNPSQELPPPSVEEEVNVRDTRGSPRRPVSVSPFEQAVFISVAAYYVKEFVGRVVTGLN